MQQTGEQEIIMKRSNLLHVVCLFLLVVFGSAPAWAASPDFCCCTIPDDPFGQGCISLVCSASNQFLCEAEYGGSWSEQSRCNLTTGACEDYTAITLSRFEAVRMAGKALIAWQTETEIDNAGFNIYRAETENGAYTKINETLIPARGSAAQGAVYTVTDATARTWKNYYYKLEDIDQSGSSTMHGPVRATPKLMYHKQ
jgi:hypothetical protein